MNTKQQSITERIKTFEDACAYLDLNPIDVLPPETIYNAKFLIASAKLAIITKALNEGWEPNWDNSSEWKYYPWFDIRSSGGGFSFYVYGGGTTRSFVGSRLCFKSRGLATYAGTQFLYIYKDFMTIEPQNENHS